MTLDQFVHDLYVGVACRGEACVYILNVRAGFELFECISRDR